VLVFVFVLVPRTCCCVCVCVCVVRHTHDPFSALVYVYAWGGEEGGLHTWLVDTHAAVARVCAFLRPLGGLGRGPRANDQSCSRLLPEQTGQSVILTLLFSPVVTVGLAYCMFQESGRGRGCARPRRNRRVNLDECLGYGEL
jgi:hypothetical protein